MATIGLIILLLGAGSSHALGEEGMAATTPGFGPGASPLPARMNDSFELWYQKTILGWSGAGTPSDPIIIQGDGTLIDAHGNTTAIFIGNVTDYCFVITGWNIVNCTGAGVSRPYDVGAGISVVNCNVKFNITSNTISASRNGILVDRSPGAATLSGNVLTNNTMAGMSVNGSTGVHLNGNTVHQCTTGLLLNHTISCNITSNTFSLNARSSIKLNDSVSGQIIGNACDGNSGTGTDAGISVTEGGANTISGNLCRDQVNGIYSSSSPYNRISGNNCSADSQYGIYAPSAHNSIENNTLLGDGFLSIYAGGGSGVKVANNTCKGPGITVTSAASPKIVDNLLRGPGGLALSGLSQGTVSQNRVGNATMDGISVSGCSGMAIRSNALQNCRMGINLTGASSNQITFNTIISGPSSGTGVRVYGGSQNTIRGNTLTSPGPIGIRITTSVSNIVIGNNLTGCTQAGILMEGSGAGNLLLTNTLLTNGIGVELSAAGGNTVQGNSIKQSTGNGIYLLSDGQNLIASNNCSQNLGGGIVAQSSLDRISNNSCWSNAGAGIGGQGGSLRVENNTCGLNAQGVAASLASGIIVRNNTIVANPTGISLTDGTSARVDHNNVTASTGNGIYLTRETGALVHDNLLTSNSGFGARATDCASCRFWQNILKANHGSGATYVPGKAQASDDSATDDWNTTSSVGNQWSDLTSTDANHDGIIDSAYALAGGGSFDNFPLASSVGPVVALNGTSHSGYILVKWSVPNYTAVSPITSYLWVRSAGGVVTSGQLPGNATEYNDTSIAAWTTYTYFLTARNAYGSSLTKNVSVGAVDTTPPAVSILAPLNGTKLNVTSLTARWTAVDAVSGLSRINLSLDGAPWIAVGTNLSYPLQNLTQGWHTLAVRAWDRAGNSMTNTTRFYVDPYAPTLRIDSPAQGALFNVTSVTVAWTAADNGSGVARNEVRLDLGPWVSVGTNGSARFNSLAQGDHNVTVRTFDGANNSATAKVGFRVDSQAPTVTITAPSGPYVNRTNITLSWTVHKSGPSQVRSEVRTDQGPWVDVGTSTSLNITLPDGPHKVEVRAVDEANNTGNATLSFVVDTVPPRVSIESPLNGSWVNTQAVLVRWNGSDATSGIGWYEVRADNGTWVNMSLALQYRTSNLADSNHSVEVRAHDKAGNIMTVVSNFRLDSVPPTVQWISPDYGTKTNSTKVTFRWNASDSYSGLNHTTVTMDGGIPVDIGMATSFTASNLTDGGHSIYVQVYDNASNVRGWTSMILVDLTPPQLNITSPQGGAIILSRSVIVSWIASDNGSGLATIYGALDGYGWEDWTLAHNWHLVNPSPAGMSDGNHTIHVKAWDNAGNFRIASVSFVVDASPPQLQIVTPSQGSWSNNTTVKVEWSGSDIYAGMDHYEIRLDGANWTSVGMNTSVTFARLGIGPHVFGVKAVSNSGMSSTVSVNFGIDQSIPSGVNIVPTPKYVRNGTIYIVWSAASDNVSGIGHYEAKIDKTYWNGASYITVNGSWLITGENTYLVISNNADGEYNVSVRAVDRAGNVGPASGVNLTLDATPPSVLSYAPLGQVSSLRPNVVVLFSEAMVHSTVHVDIAGVSGAISWSGNQVTFTPDSALSYDHVYQVSVSGNDLAGNPLPPYSWSFSTIPNQGTVSGIVVDDAGRPISGAIVRLENGQTSATDQNGGFSLSGTGGGHTLTIEVKGYTTKQLNITISAGATSNLGQMVLVKSPDDYSWVIVLVFVLLIGVAAELLYLQRKKRK